MNSLSFGSPKWVFYNTVKTQIYFALVLDRAYLSEVNSLLRLRGFTEVERRHEANGSLIAVKGTGLPNVRGAILRGMVRVKARGVFYE